MRITGDFVVSKEDSDNQVTKTLTGGSVHHETTASPPFDIRNGDQAKEKIRNGVASGK